MNISQLEIIGLYGRYNTKIPISENTLILIAKNGAGKSTILRITFYFLTKQWERLCSFDFHIIRCVIDDRVYEFEKSAYLKSSKVSNGLSEIAQQYPTYRNFITKILPNYDALDLKSNVALLENVAIKHDVPPGFLVRVVNYLIEARNPTSHLNWDTFVLFLPTYRRIEHDIEELFADINIKLKQYVTDLRKDFYSKNLSTDVFASADDDQFANEFGNDERIFTDLWSIRDQEKWNIKGRNKYLELIEFGMDDIYYKVRDIVKSSALSNIDPLPSKLTEYLRICNTYLEPYKTLVYDLNVNVLKLRFNESNTFTDLRNLSSGEKQIVSILFHLYVEDHAPFVIIDEPELSLSLRWQQKIISDIRNAKISGLLVATHSPYVVTDELRDFAHGINEFIE
ncbi:AAA family ATPase [Chitinophaga sp. CF418]|uniref:AAA family ATPase n=1 Tax=Chitinophaga sp. CF418 TaxID=1855287 RepID=UPI00090F8C34|nr:AAA family ATPase [Chitinophaga sp. CF418]SHN43698.1 AAA domain-containing protein, putative AbiEii toxin, Type IV TA system [Chitinophaga sp. CF418]